MFHRQRAPVEHLENQWFLLSPRLRDWLPEGDLAVIVCGFEELHMTWYGEPDQVGKVRVPISATREQGFEKTKLENGVMQLLRETGSLNELNPRFKAHRNSGRLNLAKHI
jgi:hypothetical protein